MKRKENIEKMFHEIKELEEKIEKKQSKIQGTIDDIDTCRDEIRDYRKKINEVITDDVIANMVGHIYKIVKGKEVIYIRVKTYERDFGIISNEPIFWLDGDSIQVNDLNDYINVTRYTYDRFDRYSTSKVLFNYAKDIVNTEEITWEDAMKDVKEFMETNLLK